MLTWDYIATGAGCKTGVGLVGDAGRSDILVR